MYLHVPLRRRKVLMSAMSRMARAGAPRIARCEQTCDKGREADVRKVRTPSRTADEALHVALRQGTAVI